MIIFFFVLLIVIVNGIPFRTFFSLRMVSFLVGVIVLDLRGFSLYLRDCDLNKLTGERER